MLRWYKPIPLTALRVADVPDRPGVYVLLGDPDDISSALKIAPARSLRDMYKREQAGSSDPHGPQPRGVMFAETWADAEEAARLIAAYRRVHGRPPPLNSQY